MNLGLILLSWTSFKQTVNWERLSLHGPTSSAVYSPPWGTLSLSLLATQALMVIYIFSILGYVVGQTLLNFNIKGTNKIT